MTSNQISYFKVKEDQRHNQAMEQETARSNRAQEDISRAQAQATKAHYERSDAETNRANLVKESQNAVTIDQDYTKLAIERGKLAETARHNRNQEEIDWVSANAKAKDAAAKMVSAQSGALLNYAKAETEYGKAALNDITAQVELARRDNIQAQTDQIQVSIPETIARTQLTRAQRDNVITQTQYIPLNTWANVIHSLSLGSAIKSI